METLWVGQIEKTPLVFDRSLQLPDCPHVFLWNTALSVMEKYVPDIVRKNIQRSREPSTIEAATVYFNAWRETTGLDWLEAERQYYQLRAEREATGREPSPAERHRERLESIGKQYLGVRKALPKKLRVTHCYSCKQTLSNSIDVECVVCGWILCNCGACGCGYSADI